MENKMESTRIGIVQGLYGVYIGLATKQGLGSGDSSLGIRA